MEDYWIRSVTGDGAVRAMAAVTTATVEQARRRHGTAPTATAALGRTLTAAGLLGATLRVGQTIFVRILGDGPLRTSCRSSSTIWRTRKCTFR